MLRAAAAQEFGDGPTDVTAAEVLGNIDAMVWAVSDADRPITVDHLGEIHRRLLAGTRLERYAGTFRTEQNWIGGSNYNPCSAVFVPPPPELVGDLMADLCAFCNDDSLPAVAQAAIAHAQFETIHPFIDGNGRTGRALIHVILRRRGFARRVLPPVSLVLATRSADYINALIGTRYEGAASSRAAHDGINRWMALFAASCVRAAEDAIRFEQQLSDLQQDWRRRVGRVRGDSAVDLLIRALPGAPIVTASSAAALINRSFQSTNAGIAKLVDANVLRSITVARRNRAFEAADVIDVFTDLERQLASPDGDTRISLPVRSVPRRRND